MKRIIVNIILISLFILLGVAIVLPFLADISLEKAKNLEASYRWKRAGEKYQAAAHLNPFNSTYFAGAADFMLRQSKYREDEDKIRWLKRAEKLYERARVLNPQYAENWYWLGRVELFISKQKAVGSKQYAVDSVVENFREAIENDPYNFRNNYLIGYDLFTIWDNLDNIEKSFALDRFKYALQTKPWYGDSVYPAVIYYAEDFSLTQEVTPQSLRGYKGLYSFIVRNNLWQYRKKVAEQVDLYQQEKEPKTFKQKRTAMLNRLKKIKETFIKEKQLTVHTERISQKEWQGKSESGKNTYKNGKMYWNGTIYAVVNMKPGKSLISIKAKKFLVILTKHSHNPKFFPYMIVKLDDKEIGEMFVDNDECGEYEFLVESDGGLKVLSVTFVNDTYTPEKEEDRNLLVGDVNVLYQ